jgi:hypothetical protein
MANVLKERLLMVGGKLAVFGVDMEEPQWWHILRPGRFNVPVLGEKLSVGTSVCGRNVTTNGYSLDFTPTGDLCPACRAQL